MRGKIEQLYHYPVKGLSAQILNYVPLEAGRGFPFDRVLGFARHDSGFFPGIASPIPKDRFLVLLKEERLAGLTSHFDQSTAILTIKVQGRRVYEGKLSAPADVESAVSFFSTMFELHGKERPIFAEAGERRFTDAAVVSTKLMNAVSLINLASLRELEGRTGLSIDGLRFRANIYFDGWPAFRELDLIDSEFTIGGARLKLILRTRRCAATEVNPATARRDIPVPRLLMEHYGHSDLGVYAEVLSPGIISPGDTIEIAGD